MDELSAAVTVATTQMAHRNEKLRGAQNVALIEGAGAVGKGSSSAPPPQPVSVPPKAGSTVEVVA